MDKDVVGTGVLIRQDGQAGYAARSQERWSMPMATLFVVGMSLALWGGIYLLVRAVFG